MTEGQLISYIVPSAPVTRQPANGNEPFLRLEIHYTPKHGSWPNIAETELSLLSRQYLDRRIESAALFDEAHIFFMIRIIWCLWRLRFPLAVQNCYNRKLIKKAGLWDRPFPC